MITFFTTFRKYTRAEKNAVNSWLALDKNIEVIVFTEEENASQWITDERVSFNRNFKRHEFGLPLLNSIFEEASRCSKNKILCYCNSDIILLSNFLKQVSPILKLSSSFLAVSQRWDVEVDKEFDFTNPIETEEFNRLINSAATIHSATGSDIFLFPKHQYNQQVMPPLVVGRPGWDLWMLYNARMRFNRLINFKSENPVVIHQNHASRYSLNNEPDRVNMKYLPLSDQYTFVLSYCNYEVRESRINKIAVKPENERRAYWEMKFNNKLLSYFYLRVRNLFRKVMLFVRLYKMPKRKFNIGSAGINHDHSWYPSNINTLDITKESDWRRILLFLKLDNIMAEYVWEYLTDEDTVLANANCFKYLKRDGVLRLAVPDGYNPDPDYIESVRCEGKGDGADDQKVLYNYKLMTERLERSGFHVKLLEYWDEQGNFHFTEWSDEGGYIRRSKRYDPRNQDGQLKYTSLIVDAIKPL